MRLPGLGWKKPGSVGLSLACLCLGPSGHHCEKTEDHGEARGRCPAPTMDSPCRTSVPCLPPE